MLPWKYPVIDVEALNDRHGHRLLATFVLIDAAFNRIRFLPAFGFDNVMAVRHAYELMIVYLEAAGDAGDVPAEMAGS